MGYKIMRKIICICLTVFIIMGLLCSCKDRKSNEEGTKANFTLNTQEVKKSEWQVGVHRIVIDSAWIEEERLFVKYIFTNNGEKPTALFLSGIPSVFQNGVQLEEWASHTSDFLTKIKPGFTIEVIECYVLRNETDDIEVEVREFVHNSPDIVSRTFEISELQIK